jgi:hypothetical protein
VSRVLWSVFVRCPVKRAAPVRRQKTRCSCSCSNSACLSTACCAWRTGCLTWGDFTPLLWQQTWSGCSPCAQSQECGPRLILWHWRSDSSCTTSSRCWEMLWRVIEGSGPTMALTVLCFLYHIRQIHLPELGCTYCYWISVCIHRHDAHWRDNRHRSSNCIQLI